MKVIFLRSNPISPDPRVEKEAETLIESGYSVKVIGWNRDNKKEKVCSKAKILNKSRLDIILFNIKGEFGGGIKKNLVPLIKFQINLLKWLLKNRDKYNIIHACDFDTVIPAYVVSKILKKKYVYDIFDYYVDSNGVPNSLKVIIKSIDRFMINNSDATIICSEKRREQIEGSKPKVLKVIHNTPKAQLKAKDKISIGNKSEKIKIAYVGVLIEGRMIKELIDIVINDERLELHIGGFGPLEEYIFNKVKCNKNIFYYGKLEYEDTLALESKCDFMTAIYNPRITNHYYAAPNKFYEALILGKPLIMVRNTGMDYIVSENNFGEIIDFNIDSLKLGIDRLIERKDEWGEISNKMNEYYDKNFNWSLMEDRLLKLYKNL